MLLGRFLQVDLLTAPNRYINIYHYASNSPVCYIDPTGMQDEQSSDLVTIVKGITLQVFNGCVARRRAEAERATLNIDFTRNHWWYRHCVAGCWIGGNCKTDYIVEASIIAYEAASPHNQNVKQISLDTAVDLVATIEGGKMASDDMDTCLSNCAPWNWATCIIEGERPEKSIPKK